jgi:hypothetical protein
MYVRGAEKIDMPVFEGIKPTFNYSIGIQMQNFFPRELQ